MRIRMLALVLYLLMIGCLAVAAPAFSSVRVAASIFPVASIVREIGGDRVAVTTIVPSGADPHNFEVTPTTARAIEEADVVFLVARPFDGWAIRDANPKQHPSPVEFQKVFEDSLVRIGKAVNPHFWLDPMFAKEMGVVVAKELSRIDSSGSAYYAARARVFVSRMDSLDASIASRLARSGFKAFVSFHPAWTYFARRYGLEERDILELTPEQEPSAKWIAKVLKDMKQNRVRFILAEEFSNKALAKAVAKESGAEVIVLDPLGGEARPGRNSYFALLDYNVSKLEEAARQSRRE
jgi:zinc transport system substrate-binding protein